MENYPFMIQLASHIIVGGFIGMVISMALEAFKAFIRKRKKKKHEEPTPGGMGISPAAFVL